MTVNEIAELIYVTADLYGEHIPMDVCHIIAQHLVPLEPPREALTPGYISQHRRERYSE